jgi:hypothetical protein
MMTPGHPRWEEFYCRLSEALAHHECDGRRDQTERVLTTMGFFDGEIADSFEYFEQRGGFCDCEVLFNVGAK